MFPFADVPPPAPPGTSYLIAAIAFGFLAAFALAVYFWRTTPKPPKGR